VDETFGHNRFGWVEVLRPRSPVDPAPFESDVMFVLTALLVFVIVLIAELPDKTMFASLMLGTRFAARWVFIGAAAAFTVHVIIAVTAGSLLALLPHRLLEGIIAALFLFGAGFMLHASRSTEKDEEEDVSTGSSTSAGAGIASSFLVIFIGEWGDITQIATANLAAKYHDPLAVGVGAALGLWAAALLAITAGRTLLKYLSVVLLHRIGALIFAALALYSIVEVIRG
jgi:putative Ca2+/H+ antiporter (TMEM165/GDT1 family)